MLSEQNLRFKIRRIFIFFYLRSLRSFLLQQQWTNQNCRTVILYIVLYVYETWSLTLAEGYRLIVFENKVQGRIFEPNRCEVTGEWERWRTWDLYGLYYSSSFVNVSNPRRMRWAEHVARKEEGWDVYRVWGGAWGSKDELEDLGVGEQIL